MARGQDARIDLTPQLLLKAYSCGLFPMAESADDPTIFWVDPDIRGIIPLDEFHISRRLMRTVRMTPFDITFDTAFPAIIDGCAEPAPGRRSTWINPTIRSLYIELFRMGHAHSVEAWQGGHLVGGLYGVSLGAAFFGESMFSRRRDASKVCLVHLVERLRSLDYMLLDTQFTTDHLKRFGAIDIPRADYEKLLERAVAEPSRGF